MCWLVKMGSRLMTTITGRPSCLTLKMMDLIVALPSAENRLSSPRKWLLVASPKLSWKRCWILMAVTILLMEVGMHLVSNLQKRQVICKICACKRICASLGCRPLGGML